MKKLLAAGLMAAGLIAAAAPVQAQDYPTRAVKILVPYGPGGATDIVARLLADQLQKQLGGSFVVENKPGAGGILATEDMARSEADGYTLMLGNVTTGAISPVIYPTKYSIDPNEDVTIVARIGEIPGFFLGTTSGGFEPKTLEELVQYAKDNEGKLRYTSAGVGSYPHLDVENLANKAGFKATHIPSSTGAQGMVQALVNGDAQFAFLNVASSSGLVKDGQLVPYAVNTEERMETFPDVPTMAELGYEGVGTFNWQALFAPAGTPEDVIQKLADGVKAAVESEEMKKAFENSVIIANVSETPAEAKEWLQSEQKKWQETTDRLGLQLN